MDKITPDEIDYFMKLFNYPKIHWLNDARNRRFVCKCDGPKIDDNCARWFDMTESSWIADLTPKQIKLREEAVSYMKLIGKTYIADY